MLLVFSMDSAICSWDVLLARQGSSENSIMKSQIMASDEGDKTRDPNSAYLSPYGLNDIR